MKKIKIGVVRKAMGLRGGRAQISSHGTGEFSIQIIRDRKVRENCTIPTRIVEAARK